MTKEPAVIISTITGIVGAIIAVLVAFVPGVMSDLQQDAVLALVAVVAPVVAGILIRRKVTPTAKVLELESNGDVVAGPANDLVRAGKVIRPAAPPEAA